PDGVWFVELAPLDDADLVPEAIVAALGLRGAGDATENLRAHLAGHRALLVIDNCEHVIDNTARLVTELLAACPSLNVLATSREPLRVPGEIEHTVEPLQLSEAAALLIDRASGAGRTEADDRHTIER